MPPRTVVVDRQRFQIDRELTVQATPTWAIHQTETDWSAVFAGKRLPMYSIACGAVASTAKITPTAGHALADWQAGFVQNVTQSERTGKYGETRRIRFGLPEGIALPIRDAEHGELPFSYAGTPVARNVAAKLSESDEPRLDLPRVIEGASLTETGGADELVTWLALARITPPRKVVLLGRAVWQIDWSAAVENGQLRHGNSPVLAVVATDQGLQRELSAAPPLGDGRTSPDFRCDASMNSFEVGELHTNGITYGWQYDDEDQPVACGEQALGPKTWFS